MLTMHSKFNSLSAFDRLIQIAVLIVLIASIVLSVTFLYVFLLPYPQSASLVNHIASDGQLESFTMQRYHQLRLPALTGAVILTLFCFVGLFRIGKLVCWVSDVLHSIPAFLRRFWKDSHELLRALAKYCDRRVAIALIAVTIMAFVLRILLIQQPMQHDEAYSAVIFGFEPLHNSLSDYHYPNNHVFHTLLVHFSYLLFGAKEWAVRLPAFLSGVLLAPLGFILAKRWYGTKTAWLTGIMIASLPALIDYSVNARGYTLMALFTLLLFILGTYLKSHQNLAAWFLVILFGALGFYTLPIMVYPLAIFYIWMGLFWLVADTNKEQPKNHFLRVTILAGILTTILGLALYIPIYRNWGIKSLFANPYVEALATSTFDQTLNSRILDAWQMLNSGNLPWVGYILVIGFTLSIIFHRRISKEKLPPQVISVVTIALLVVIQRPNIYARTWIFYLPLLCIWAAAGLIAIFEQQAKSVQLPRTRSMVFMFLLVWSIFFALGGILFNIAKYPASVPQSGDIEKATLFLKDQLEPDDIVVITAIDDAPMWFYFAKYGLPKFYFERNRPFGTAYVIVNPDDNQTVNSVISDRGPDGGFFDYSTQQLLISVGQQQIFMISADSDALKNAYKQGKSP